MTLRTQPLSAEEKKEIISTLFLKHKPVFEHLNIENPLFIPKMNYYNQELNCRVVGFFDSELKHAKDIYIEFVDRTFLSEDAERRLYKWTFDPDYKTTVTQEYDEVKKFTKYLIPVTKFILIDIEPLKKHNKPIDINVDKNHNDLPISELTIKDIFAILHKVPVSNKQWLNILIKQLNQ